MKFRIFALLLCGALCSAAADSVAARLASEARRAEDSGQVVRAYLLYSEAAARDPHNATYRANRDALASAAKLLTKADVENADISADIKAAESEPPNSEPPLELATKKEWERDENLQPIPHIQANSSKHDFNLQGDEKSLFQQVASAYGVRAIWDPQLEPQSGIRFQLDQADFRTALEALTAVTHTFVFPISQQALFFVRDTEAKRNELEPNVLLTFPLPNALEQKDLLEAANAVRGVLNLRAIGWDSANRIIMIRDRYTRARAARSLMEAVLLPKAQVSLEVQFLTFDSDRSYHYGASLPTVFQLVDFGHIGRLQSIIPSFSNAMNFLTFGGGATLFGLGLTNASVFATYSNSTASTIYDSTSVVGDGQIANLHIGDKYPIPQTLYTGFQQSAASIYNPIGQVTLEDLGLLLKMTPHVNGDGDVSLEIEADLKALGNQVFNTVPSVSEREFKGSIVLREGEWAVLAGMNVDTVNVTRNGWAGLSQIPGLNQILSENTRDTQTSDTLLVIKPRITRLPMSGSISPQYLLGPARGERVLL